VILNLSSFFIGISRLF